MERIDMYGFEPVGGGGAIGLLVTFKTCQNNRDS